MQGKSFQRYLGLGVFLLFSLSCSLFSPPPMEPVPITQIPSLPPPATEDISSEEDPVSAIKLPNGIVTQQNNTLTLFDLDGYTITQVEPPYASAYMLHIAGPLPAGNTNLPLIYYSFEQNNSILFYNYGQVTTLKSAPYFANMIGAEGHPFIAYATAEFADDALISNLYVGTPESLPTAEAVLNDVDPQGWALSALAIDVDGLQATGIWYTKTPWGISGP